MSEANQAGRSNEPPPTTSDAPIDVAPLTGAAPPATRTARTASRNISNPSFRGAQSGAASASSSSSATGGRSPSLTPSMRSTTPGGGPSRPTVSMVPSRGASASLRGQPKMMFKPNMPQRRKPSEGASGTQIKQESDSSLPSGSPRAGSSSSAAGGRGGRGARGGAAGGRGGRQRADIPLVASGPFSQGTGSASRPDRARRLAAIGVSSSAAPGRSSSGPTLAESDSLKPDPGRMSYRDPDKLKEREEYSDQEEGVEIIDLDDVDTLDPMAPRALPRVEERQKKRAKKDGTAKAKVKREKGKGPMIKADPEDEEQAERERLSQSSSRGSKAKRREKSGSPAMSISSDSSPASSDEDTKRESMKTADALDLSESEEEEMMDDLVDDFLFSEDQANEAGQYSTVDPSELPANALGTRLFLFQFPQKFPKFEPSTTAASDDTKAKAEKEPSKPPSALSSSPPGSSNMNKPRRSVAFAEGTTGGSGSTTKSPTDTPSAPPTSSTAGVKRELDSGTGKLPGDRRDLGPEGQIGQLKIYKDGRVEMHFTPSDSSPGASAIVMELTGSSQPTFLQDLAILDASTARATVLGEVHRKFTVSPNVDCMLDDEARWLRVKDEEDS